MPDYNLNGLNNRSFEHIVQSIAKSEIANGVMPFGDGPDGGREATFKGKMNYPSVTGPWDGYLVIQSKFRLHPTGDPKKDGEWLMDQISAEFAKFSDPNRALKRPEYYLATTNVRLSAVADKGTRDRVSTLLEENGKKLGFKGQDCWAYDDLCRFIDNNEGVRKAHYTDLITCGDVVDMFKNVSGQKNRMAVLIEKFKKERENDEVFVGIISKLQHFNTSADGNTAVEGVTSKLSKAGMDHFVSFAIHTKELYVKKLAEFQFSKSAQEIHCLLLAEVYTRFHYHVWPALCTGRTETDIAALVQQHIISPVSEMLTENVVDLYSDELSGMLYFLTGNCHIRWSNSRC
jgi:hypothetical protein